MSNFDSGGGPENEWDERGDLVWNEFDWERYLREQDETIRRYLGYYEAFKGNPDRIDEVAELMGWGQDEWTEEERSEEAEEAKTENPASGDFSEEKEDVYTLHKNPIFIATKAISLSLKSRW